MSVVRPLSRLTPFMAQKARLGVYRTMWKEGGNCDGWKGKRGKGGKGQPPFPGLHPGLDTEEKMRSILCQNTREKKVCQCLLAA